VHHLSCHQLTFSRLAILRPASQDLRIQLAYLSYFLIDTTIAINEVKKCLHFDPDNKGCKKLHKLFRSIEKDLAKARNWIEGGNPRKGMQLLRGEDGVIAKFEKAMDDAIAGNEIPPQFHAKQRSITRAELYALACRGSVDAGDFTSKAAAFCDTALELDPENESALVFRGERLLKEEKWDEAVAAFQQAFEKSGRQSQDIMNRMQKAQRLLKVSKQKDYYKVLGVARDADERTIKKAFRKAAKTNHPDVGGSEDKMAQINEAYEVLSDPELRARFDNGDDPNDPTGGAGGNPFAHHSGGGMPFFFQQGGGFPGGGFPGGGFPGGGGGGGGGGHKFHFQWGQ
jgi:DnaJ family protein C protein 3